MTPIPPMPATWPEQRKYIGKLNELGAKKLIKEILADKPPKLFHLAVGRIMEKLLEENYILAFLDVARIPDLAWAVRNIMELRVISLYVCQSQNNLQRFENDIIINGATTLQALLTLSQNLAREVPNPQGPTPDLYRQQADMQKARIDAGLGQEEPLKARVCARKVTKRLEMEYLLVGSVTSTLIHPCAISVLKTFNLESYRDVLVINGLILATKLIEEAREHIEKFGYKPAK